MLIQPLYFSFTPGASPTSETPGIANSSGTGKTSWGPTLNCLSIVSGRVVSLNLTTCANCCYTIRGSITITIHQRQIDK